MNYYNTRNLAYELGVGDDNGWIYEDDEDWVIMFALSIIYEFARIYLYIYNYYWDYYNLHQMCFNNVHIL